jgi:hypothetical protein
VARVSRWLLYGRPAVIVLAAMSVGVAFAVNLRDPARNQADFYTFWDAARWLRAGLDPYTAEPLRPGAGYNLNPPVTLLLFVPFSWLPLVPAFIAWTIVSFVCYAFSAWAIAREVAPGRVIEVGAFLLISQATFLALQLGQPGGLLTAAMTAAWIADRRRAFFVAGVLLGVSMAVKLFLGLFLFYAIWRRSSRLAAGLLTGFAATVLAGFIPAGLGGYRSWFFVLGQVTWAAHLANASLLGFFTRILTVPPPGFHVTPLVERPQLVQPLWLCSVATVATVALWRARRTRDINHVWLIVLAGSFVCSPLGWIYYWSLAAGPLVATAVGGPRRARTLIAIGYACCLVPYTWLVLRPLGMFGTAAFGSIYMWGLLFWFASAAVAAGAPARPHPIPGVS